MPDASMFDPEEEPQAAAVTSVGGSVISGTQSRAVIRGGLDYHTKLSLGKIRYETA